MQLFPNGTTQLQLRKETIMNTNTIIIESTNNFKTVSFKVSRSLNKEQVASMQQDERQWIFVGRNRSGKKHKSPIIGKPLNLPNEYKENILKSLQAAKRKFFHLDISFFSGMSPEKREEKLRAIQAGTVKPPKKPIREVANLKPIKETSYICTINESGEVVPLVLM